MCLYYDYYYYEQEQCTACPPNSHTVGEGSTSLAACSCMAQKGEGGKCEVCDSGSFIDEKGLCTPCPAGTTSTKGSNLGIQSCACGPGFKVTSASNKTVNCEPCPLGYFSRNVGMSCTPCGKDMTTANVGSTSLRDCIK